MRNLFVLCLLAMGCTTTPTVKLRVPASAAQRLDAAKREQGMAVIAATRQRLANAESELKKARGEKTEPAGAADKRRTPELDAVLRATEDRQRAVIAWRQAQVHALVWQLAADEAQLELVTATVVTRYGVDVDPEAFRAEVARLQAGHGEAARKLAGTRAALDRRESALVDAKNKYAATIKTTAIAATHPTH